MAKKKKERPEGSGNNKGIGILLGIMIVITWLSVMCLLIKCDVGGFGSKVLRPVLKDIPVINKILPDDLLRRSNYYKEQEAEDRAHVCRLTGGVRYHD